MSVDSRRPTYRAGNLLATGVQKEKRQDNWFPGMDSMDWEGVTANKEAERAGLRLGKSERGFGQCIATNLLTRAPRVYVRIYRGRMPLT